MANHPKEIVTALLEIADVKIDGDRPWDIKVLNPGFYSRVLAEGSMGLGESYMDGWWTSESVDEMICRLMDAKIEDRVKVTFKVAVEFLRAKFFNSQSMSRAFEVGEKHYDLGNDFFIPMLGKSMAYSCAYWKDAQNLDDAEFAKFDLICRKLSLKPGQRILDIGSGWGGFAKYAAEKYGVSVVGLSVSKEQVAFAEELCKGLPVEFRLQDYRTLNEKFDHIVSVGMFEHVGPKNYRTYMELARKCLNEDGLFLLHTIGTLKTEPEVEWWIRRYIFPNGVVPSLKQISESVEGLFVIEDVHNIGADYDKTLMAWNENFQKSWPQFQKQYGDRFYRMWKYYLLSCAGAFRARQIELWQVVLSPKGVKGGYTTVR